RRPEREPRHEAALPASGPLAHRQLERGGEGGVYRVRRIPEPQEPVVAHLARHVRQITIAVEEALPPPPPSGITLEESGQGVSGPFCGTGEHGGPATRCSAGQAADGGDRKAVDTLPPPACPVLGHHEGVLRSFGPLLVPQGDAGQVVPAPGQPISYSPTGRSIDSIESARPEAGPEPVFDASRRHARGRAGPLPSRDQRHARRP